MSSSSRRGGGKGRKRPQKAGNEDVADLEARCVAEAPAPGSSDGSKVAFAELALSKLTVVGLREGNFTKMTRIQQIALPHALAGRDIMGAAKTGSGKTLAFLVPVLERLYRQNWSSADGLGAVVMSPTRELALQIFEVLRVVGREHESLSVGLVTGGKRLDDEVERIVGMNILVCTPGRLLQHLEQTPGFHCDDVSILVLDEADRMLDMGFEREMNSIMEYMPPKEHGRQTLLFSATQPKSVKDLARLSLSHPEYLAVHEHAKFATPAKLIQNYTVCPLQDKLDVLFAFMKSHLKKKTIVFLSSCKQVGDPFEGTRERRKGGREEEGKGERRAGGRDVRRERSPYRSAGGVWTVGVAPVGVAPVGNG